MDYNKPYNFLKKLPPKLNSFYKTKSKYGLVVSNKSKTKKDRGIIRLKFLMSANGSPAVEFVSTTFLLRHHSLGVK